MSKLSTQERGMISIVAIAVTLGLAWAALMIWWLIWSILDLVHGNPATFWNIAGIVVPVLSALGGGSRIR